VALFALAIVSVTGTSSLRAELLTGASLALGALVVLAVARYDSFVAFGFLIFGVIFVQPGLPDLVFGIVMLVALLTGGGRFTLRNTPTVILYTLAAFLVLDILASAWAPSLGHAVFFMSITVYLMAFAVWLTAYVHSSHQARRVMQHITVGATITAAVSLAMLFLPLPGRNLLTFADATRAKGFFDDPNVFGAFMSVPFAWLLSELVERRLISWRRRRLVLMLVITGAAVLFSFSRAAWLNVAIIVLTMLSMYVLRQKGGRQAVAVVGVALATAAVLTVFVFATGSQSFLLGRAQLQSYDTARFHGQDASLTLARTHVFGIGPGQYADTVGIGAHSTYLRALGEEGILGLTFIAGLFLVTLVLAWGNAVAGRTTFGISATVLLGLWLGLVASSFFIDTLHWRHLWLVAGLIWAGAARRVTAGSPASSRPGRLSTQDLARQR
jgi:O-antigen ligase